MTLSLSGNPEADELLSSNPFALLVGMVLDQQVPFEWAFAAPKTLRDRLGGTLDATTVAATDPDQLAKLFSERPALHRFPASMAGRVHELARTVVDDFGGDPTAIWTSAKTGNELVSNLSSLPGFGKQKSQIFAALLAKRLGVRPTGWREATAPYGEPKAMMSIADVDGPETLAQVREHKRQMKAAAKTLAVATGQDRTIRGARR